MQQQHPQMYKTVDEYRPYFARVKEMKSKLIQNAQAWITQFYLQTTPCLPFLRERSPDVTTTATEATSNCSSLLIYRPRKD